MPITFKIDHAKRHVEALAEGGVTLKDIEEFLDALVVQGAIPYRKLFDGRRSVADHGSVTGRDRAGRIKDGTQSRELLAGRLGSRPFITRHDDFRFALFDRQRDDFLIKQTLSNRSHGASVTLGRVLVLILTSQSIGLRQSFGDLSHRTSAEGTGQTVLQQNIEQFSLAQRRPRPFQQIRSTTHRLHAPRHDDV